MKGPANPKKAKEARGTDKRRMFAHLSASRSPFIIAHTHPYYMSSNAHQPAPAAAPQVSAPPQLPPVVYAFVRIGGPQGEDIAFMPTLATDSWQPLINTLISRRHYRPDAQLRFFVRSAIAWTHIREPPVGGVLAGHVFVVVSGERLTPESTPDTTPNHSPRVSDSDSPSQFIGGLRC
eukprot:TRINITY_DN25967_c0_g1_i1.p1 TRINITY_DN25967_c0_g1~~TRINITY_DN25967_c0_g1_i1.p1  ORF type:complete len:178 (+),score=0.73 TRINITY_DN25967_c0_g1_i1:212-745(+)